MQPNTFDLKAAREIALDPNFYGNAPYLAANLNAALDEIARMNVAYDHESKLLSGSIGRIKALESNNLDRAKRIAELEAALQVEKSAHEETKYADSEVAIQAFSRIAKQRAALKKLGQAKRERGKALVEERARRICHVPGDPVGHWARYEKVVVDEAREQLVHEGKL